MSARPGGRRLWGACQALQQVNDTSPFTLPMQISERTQKNIRVARNVAAHGAAGAARVANTITDISVKIADSIVNRCAWALHPPIHTDIGCGVLVFVSLLWGWL